MKAAYLNLKLITGTVYNKLQTSLLGRFGQRTINSNLCFGAPPNSVMDAFTDAALTPTAGIEFSNNERVFKVGTVTTGSAQILLYNKDKDTGIESYVGRTQITLPNTAATTHVVRICKVDDVGTTGWKIFVTTTASVLINGGLFVVNKVDLSDFGNVSFTTFPMAHEISGTDMKAVYFLQAPTEFGVGHLGSAGWGLILDETNKFAYFFNGTAAVYQCYKFNYNTALSLAFSQVATLTIASPGKVNITAHGLANNMPVALYTTGALPTGLTASNATTQTVYFTRNVTANDFELSATTGGASINFTGAQSGVHRVKSAFGITSSAFTLKSGNLPAGTGTIVSGSAFFATPDHGSILTQGFPCAFFATTTNFYVGRLSEITNGGTTWPSLNTVNNLGAINEATTPSALFAVWSEEMQVAIYVTNTATFVVKKLVNNQIIGRFGSLSTQYLEGMPGISPDFALAAIIGLTSRHGWLLMCGNTAGQRVTISYDLYSDEYFNFSRLISTIFPTKNIVVNFVQTIQELIGVSSHINIRYRTDVLTSTIFDSADGGWANIALGEDLSSLVVSDLTQVEITESLIATQAQTPAQIVDLAVGYTPPDEMGDGWVGSMKHSSLPGASPFYQAFRLQVAYVAGVVPPLRVDITDDADNIVQSFDTITDASLFSYTTNDGVSWNALGTIPNVALTTEVRILITNPFAGKIRTRIIEA